MSISEALRPPQLLEDYLSVRAFSESLIDSLSPEDCALQAMDDTSPPKWHLAHTTWFFETFLLTQYLDGYQPFHSEFQFLFNSYYNQVGDQFSRPQRHLLSRPSLEDVMLYRRYVDEAMSRWVRQGVSDNQASLITLGLNHEQQHQELLLMDIKYSFFQNPLLPAVLPKTIQSMLDERSNTIEFITYNEGLYQVGAGGSEFCYDNETPVHQVFLPSFSLSNRLVTNAEYLEFMRQGGYEHPEYWLSDGWTWKQKNNITQPLYWNDRDMHFN